MTDATASDSVAELTPIRTFVCSSGDMIAERQAALRVIEALNRAAHGAARLEPYLWEENTHRFQGTQSYQGNIPLPAEFDIFLGFLFSRIGSRLTEERDIFTRGRRERINNEIVRITPLSSLLAYYPAASMFACKWHSSFRIQSPKTLPEEAIKY